MNRRSAAFIAVVLAAAALGSSVRAETHPDATSSAPPSGALGQFGIGPSVRELAAESRLKMIELSAAAEAERTAKARFEAGVIAAADLSEARARLERAKEAVVAAQQIQIDAERLEALAKPIDIDLRDATLAQAAAVLAKVSGTSIHLAPSLAGSRRRVTAKARSVCLAAILESIGVAASLAIAPGENGTIWLLPAPSLKVGGREVNAADPHAPWSRAWLAYPEPPVAIGAFRGWRGGAGGSAPSATGPGPVTQIVDLGGAVSLGAAGPGQFVVAERGMGSDGRPGTWLSLYRVVGNNMTRVSTAFHRVSPPAAPRRTQAKRAPHTTPRTAPSRPTRPASAPTHPQRAQGTAPR